MKNNPYNLLLDEMEDEEERRRRAALHPAPEPAAVPAGVDLRPAPLPSVQPYSTGTPPQLRDKGRAVFRPAMESTGDSLADVQEYRRQLEGYTDPKAKDHWAVAALKKGLEGAA